MTVEKDHSLTIDHNHAQPADLFNAGWDRGSLLHWTTQSGTTLLPCHYGCSRDLQSSSQMDPNVRILGEPVSPWQWKLLELGAKGPSQDWCLTLLLTCLFPKPSVMADIYSRRLNVTLVQSVVFFNCISK